MMLDTILSEILNVTFTLFSVVVIAWVVWKLFNFRLFENFRLDDSDDEYEDY
jgi:hypothetical protein